MKPKICIVSPYIPPDFAGAGRRSYNQACYLAEQGYEITVLTTTKVNAKKKKLDINTVNIPFFYKSKGFLSKIMRIIHLPVLLFNIYKIIKSKKIDIVHCIPSQPWFCLLSILAAKLNKSKVVTETTLYGSDDPITIRNSRLGYIKYKLINLSNKIISISPLLHEACKKTTIDKSKLAIIGNSVDTIKFQKVDSEEKINLKKKLGLSINKKVLLYLGIIRPRKGIEQLIHMFNSLTKQEDNICLVLAGPLKKDKENILYSKKLKQIIEGYNLESKIIFTGEINNASEYLKASDIFLFASKREGFGTVIIEAMSSSLPVVTYDIPKITEYIIENKKDGVIVENETEMINYVKKLLRNPNFYNTVSSNARQTILNRFSEDVIMKQYIDTYNNII
ncbi:MAG TPA: glycosyltransferase family 4 protein [Pseudogracilibacillus sp.]|nr:glycosyltransferase family 4 protein [Pseudogracilibacillus sp.]